MPPGPWSFRRPEVVPIPADQTVARLPPVAGEGVLIAPDPCGLHEALEWRLVRAGARVVRIGPSAVPTRSVAAFPFDPADESALQLAVDRAVTHLGTVRGLYWLPGLGPTPGPRGTRTDTWPQIVQTRLMGLLHAVAALESTLARRPDSFVITLVGRGGDLGRLGPRPTSPLHGALAGLTIGLAARSAAGLIRCVDLDPAWAADAASGAMATECLINDGRTLVGHADDQRWAVDLSRCRLLGEGQECESDSGRRVFYQPDLRGDDFHGIVTRVMATSRETFERARISGTTAIVTLLTVPAAQPVPRGTSWSQDADLAACCVSEYLADYMGALACTSSMAACAVTFVPGVSEATTRALASHEILKGMHRVWLEINAAELIPDRQGKTSRPPWSLERTTVTDGRLSGGLDIAKSGPEAPPASRMEPAALIDLCVQAAQGFDGAFEYSGLESLDFLVPLPTWSAAAPGLEVQARSLGPGADGLTRLLVEIDAPRLAASQKSARLVRGAVLIRARESHGAPAGRHPTVEAALGDLDQGEELREDPFFDRILTLGPFELLGRLRSEPRITGPGWSHGYSALLHLAALASNPPTSGSTPLVLHSLGRVHHARSPSTSTEATMRYVHVMIRDAAGDVLRFEASLLDSAGRIHDHVERGALARLDALF